MPNMYWYLKIMKIKGSKPVLAANLLHFPTAVPVGEKLKKTHNDGLEDENELF